MSDDDDASDVGPFTVPVTVPEASPAAPEVSKGWSVEDRRMLIITVGGGLAANLGTVILVGAAIALTRVNKHRTPGQLRDQLIAVATILIIGPFVIAAVNAVRRGRRFGPLNTAPIWRLITVLPGARAASLIAWLFILLGWALVLEALLILTGLAAGIK